MRGALFEFFGGPIAIVDLPDPVAPETGVVLKVEATGICRSDWHGWMGHDPDIRLPHVPGHELVGTIIELGKGVRNWKPGQRVTMPFVAGCGHCEPCLTGNQQVCDHQFQPGFTHWGSFAQYVAIHYADMNLVRLPEGMDSVAAASLGCRFATAFRALETQAKVRAGDWVAIHGCGGVGLSGVMIARAMGARVVAVDIDTEKLDMAKSLGADFCVDSRGVNDLPGAVREITGGGAQVSMDALGNPKTCFNSVACLAKRGRHVQVGRAEQSRPSHGPGGGPGAGNLWEPRHSGPSLWGHVGHGGFGAFTSRAFGNRPIYAPGGGGIPSAHGQLPGLRNTGDRQDLRCLDRKIAAIDSFPPNHYTTRKPFPLKFSWCERSRRVNRIAGG